MTALVINGPGDGRRFDAEKYGPRLCLPYPPKIIERLYDPNEVAYQTIRKADYELMRIYIQITPGQAQEYLFYTLPGTTHVDIMNALFNNYPRTK